MALTKSQQVSQILLQAYISHDVVPIGMITDIAEVVDCSRQLVDQQRKRMGLEGINDQYDFTHPCKMCGKAIPNERAAMFCNSDCRSDYTKVTKGGWYMCEECGKTTHVYFHRLSYATPRFCSKQCLGLVNGKKFGCNSGYGWSSKHLKVMKDHNQPARS